MITKVKNTVPWTHVISNLKSADTVGRYCYIKMSCFPPYSHSKNKTDLSATTENSLSWSIK